MIIINLKLLNWVNKKRNKEKLKGGKNVCTLLPGHERDTLACLGNRGDDQILRSSSLNVSAARAAVL